MTDFTVRSDSVNVEDIMQRIRARIREKRGVDYTEEEIRTIATAKLERFLDPSSVRSDLAQHYQRLLATLATRVPKETLPPAAPHYGFEDSTIYQSSETLVGTLIRTVRRLLNPVLKLLFNPNPIIQVLHMQSAINARVAEQIDLLAMHNAREAEKERVGAERDALGYEVLTNLVIEITRLGIEVKNLKMRMESLSSRLDFDERRARALESVVEYRPVGGRDDRGRTEAGSAPAGADGQRARRRRRRGRRPGPTPGDEVGGTSQDAEAGHPTPPATASPQPSEPAPVGGPPPGATADPDRSDQ